jgi:hypothetical protein
MTCLVVYRRISFGASGNEVSYLVVLRHPSLPVGDQDPEVDRVLSEDVKRIPLREPLLQLGQQLGQAAGAGDGTVVHITP